MSDKKKKIGAKIKKWILIFAIVFAGLFLFKFFGELSSSKKETKQAKSGQISYKQDNISSLSFGRRNYASKKYKRKLSEKYISKEAYIPTTRTVTVEQKFEKSASIGSRSSEFKKDEKAIRSTIKKIKAIIQYEKKSGLKPYRNLKLSIGVDLDKFDEMVDSIKEIGKLTSLSIDKIEKTSEFINLNAKKKSLEKMRNSLMKLKGRNGRIEEFIELETEILEVEKQLQALGGLLGDFSAENEFCTIRLELSETRIIKSEINILSILKKATLWTLKWAFLSLFALILVLLTVLVVNKIFDNLGWLPDVIKSKMAED